MDISETLLDVDGNEASSKEWRNETLMVCRQNARKKLAPIAQALVEIFEQFSSLHGDVDVDTVSKQVAVISDHIPQFFSAVRLTAAILDEPPKVPITSLCQDMADAVRTIFDNLPKPDQGEISMLLFFSFSFLLCRSSSTISKNSRVLHGIPTHPPGAVWK